MFGHILLNHKKSQLFKLAPKKIYLLNFVLNLQELVFHKIFSDLHRIRSRPFS